jgi:hypothetical protein
MSPGEVRSRADAARAFARVAAMVLGDDSDPEHPRVVGALAVLAGIAAGDAVCGHVLKRRAAGQDHRQAVDMLRGFREGEPFATDLARLLEQKSNAQYGTTYLSAARAGSMLEHARRMVERMDAVLPAG